MTSDKDNTVYVLIGIVLTWVAEMEGGTKQGRKGRKEWRLNEPLESERGEEERGGRRAGGRGMRWRGEGTRRE